MADLAARVVMVETGGPASPASHLSAQPTTRLTHDTGFAPTCDVATAVADYVAWRADNAR